MRKWRTREHIIADLSVNHVERHFLRSGHTVQRVIFARGKTMTRTYETIAGLMYRNLDAILTGLGYTRHEAQGAVRYHYPKDEKALLLFPQKALDEEIRGIDLVPARCIVDSFGILDGNAFDLLLLRYTNDPVPALTQ